MALEASEASRHIANARMARAPGQIGSEPPTSHPANHRRTSQPDNRTNRQRINLVSGTASAATRMETRKHKRTNRAGDKASRPVQGAQNTKAEAKETESRSQAIQSAAINKPVASTP